ncbi:glycosyl-phosphatidylinositol-anchored molecule-like protein [Castor canadensis]|uniref:Glycosyl-phosphatidylinositol-anchored molecule-like protein n=3 Tax=Castor canadensis TaxID=51338 RepID=A0AC58M158_CASCN|nr:glycosyl-phosphatidylinositol-anchored molecule-like protein [Castor canadensis]
MMLPFALLLVVGFPHVETNSSNPLQKSWTFNLKCHECSSINNFGCETLRTCVYEIRRCMTIAIRLNSRELLVYKNCTWNCTFVYARDLPPETPRKLPRTNSFFFTFCCSGMTCNSGGPSNVERDLLTDYTTEEDLPEGTMRLGQSQLFLSLASLLVSSTLL